MKKYFNYTNSDEYNKKVCDNFNQSSETKNLKIDKGLVNKLNFKDKDVK